MQRVIIDNLRVVFNNAYRRVLNLPWLCSACPMYVNFSVLNFEAVIRMSTYGFIQRLAKSTTSHVVAIEMSCIVRNNMLKNFGQKDIVHHSNNMESIVKSIAIVI